jgi:GT2 family glycosyltransferase
MLRSFTTKKFAFELLSLPEKKGPAAARNMGWKAARAELVLFTDDDCLPGRNWVDAYYNAWRAQQKEIIAFTGQIIVPRSATPTDYEKNISQLETAAFLTANCACSKQALIMVNGFDETFFMAWREDSDLEFKLISQHTPIHFIQQAVVIHPVREAGWGVSLKEQRKSMFNALLFKKYPDLYRAKISSQPLWNYYAMILLFVIALLAAFLQNPLVTLIALFGWLLLEISFIKKRLTGTRRSPAHVLEMIITSLLIPFLSVYWTIYGSVKFKTYFL